MAGVQFSVTAPPYVRAGERFDLDLWAHSPEDRERIPTDAPRASSDSTSALAASLHVDGLDTTVSAESVHWSDGIGSAGFELAVPADAAIGSRSGTISVHLMGLQVARVYFSVQVGEKTAPRERIPVRPEHHRRAIAAFAPADRERVLERLRAFEKAAPGVDVFLDASDLLKHREGLARFLDLIAGGHVLYLFWSENAVRSSDVEREWRYALRLRGLDFIQPVALDPPDAAPLPEELAMLAGGEWPAADGASPAEGPPPPEASV